MISLKVLCFFVSVCLMGMNAAILENEPDTENKLLEDLTTEDESQRNFIFIDIRTNVRCKFKTCERYTSDNLTNSLQTRGKRLAFSNSIISVPSENPNVPKN